MNESTPEGGQNDIWVLRAGEAILGALRNSRDPLGKFQRAWRAIGRFLGWCTFLYVLFLAILLTALEFRAERHWLTSFLLFVPAQMYLSPLFVLTPLCLLFRPLLCWMHLGCLILVFGIYDDPNWSDWREPKGAAIKVMTNNYGQYGKHTPRGFIEQENPDIIAFQEDARAIALAKYFTNYFSAASDEFVLLSKFPIKKAVSLATPRWQNFPVAARFELDYEGRTLVVYNVHLPTPRAELESLKGIGLLAALVGREGHYGQHLRKLSADFWAEQTQRANELLAQIKQEKEPYFILGDFNVPSHGVIYHAFASEFTDAFTQSGRGYGYTFPGATRNPFTLFGPWMRLDYIYAGPAFEPVYCRAEPARVSQHRALTATLEFKAKP